MNVNHIKNIMKVYSEQNKTTKTAKKEQTGPTQQKDEVILSPKAQEFGQMLQSIKSLPDVREDKVKDLSQKITGGTYQVDAKDVADKIIEYSKTDI